MGKKMKLPFLSKTSQFTTPSWPWPSCGTPKTLSFRSNSDILKTVNAAYVVNHVTATCTKIEEKNVHDVKKHENHTSEVQEPDNALWLEGAIEEVTIGLRSDDRLMFDPGETRSILQEGKNGNSPYKESVVMVMDSRDPCIDFKKSMDEMVEAHEIRDWESLEELLNCYLRVNEEKNYGYVIGAFVDLLVELSLCSLKESCSDNDDEQGETSSSNNTVHDSISSPLSFSFSTFSTSPCLSNSLELVENDGEKEVDSGS